MKFQIIHLKKFLHSIQQNEIKQIRITSNQFELTVNKVAIHEHKIGDKILTQNSINQQTQKQRNIKMDSSKVKQNNTINKESEIYSTIISPMVGTFYRSPAPNEAPFIKTQDIVQKSQTVCLIEAMKLMNEIEAEVNGEIIEILVQDGDIVDCGQALMKVKPL
nr:acetyl-CoA carboxylase biotin carboxyl carrier protein [Ahnfeltia fastigiata]